MRQLDFTTKSKVVVKSTLLNPRPNRFTRAVPPIGSRDPFRLSEGGALPYKGARHSPGFSLGKQGGGEPAPRGVEERETLLEEREQVLLARCMFRI